jgi:hypothetical protein
MFICLANEGNGERLTIIELFSNLMLLFLRKRRTKGKDGSVILLTLKTKVKAQG